MTDGRRPRSARARAAIAGLALVLAATLAALGIWQLERREWKHALIAAVAERAHTAPVPAPGAAAWRMGLEESGRCGAAPWPL